MEATYGKGRNPCGRELKEAGERANEGDVVGRVADREEVGYHLAAEAQDGEVEQGEHEGREESSVLGVELDVLVESMDPVWNIIPRKCC